MTRPIPADAGDAGDAGGRGGDGASGTVERAMMVVSGNASNPIRLPPSGLPVLDDCGTSGATGTDVFRMTLSATDSGGAVCDAVGGGPGTAFSGIDACRFRRGSGVTIPSKGLVVKSGFGLLGMKGNGIAGRAGDGLSLPSATLCFVAADGSGTD
ncbi:MAG: hypothetical protein RBT16_05605 [Desulfococcus multivorans]|nr:hypothetical protein [Desulfococcus multivorans]